MFHFSRRDLFPILLFIPFLLHAGETASKDLQAILHAQDQRDAGTLLSYLRSNASELRLRATMAAASVQDTSLIGSLSGLLEDPLPEVRRVAALSLGQMTAVITEQQRRAVSEALLKRLHAEQDDRVLLLIIEAVGKVGDLQGLEQMVAEGHGRGGLVRSETALAVGRFAYRNIKSVQGTRFASECLQTDEAHGWKAAYALMRIGVDSLLAPHFQVIAPMLKARDADTRMFLATALGATGLTEAVPLLLDAARADRDWRVRINATKALGNAKDEGETVTDALIELSFDANEHVSLTALTTLRGRSPQDSTTADKILVNISSLLEDSANGMTARQRGSAAVTLASLFHDRVAGRLDASRDHGLLREEDYVECLGFLDSQKEFDRLLDFSRSDKPRTARAALDALDAIIRRDPKNEMRKKAVTEALVGALRSEDMAVMTTGAIALGDSLYADPGLVPGLTSRLGELEVPEDVEVIVAMIQTLGVLKSEESIPALRSMLGNSDRTVALEAAKALEQITGRSFAGEIPARSDIAHTDYDWAFLESLSGSLVEVETSAGTFAFELLPDAAPFTCVNFARLIGSGFYDGLIFHRVVPNFVVQGGDPRGDGWGGPGYSIRSEFALETYERGMVGVASAGKDTEGCQFFVTHSKQPHLDGRYTIFGKVVSGMDVVDRIQVGDKIGKMSIGTRNAPARPNE